MDVNVDLPDCLIIDIFSRLPLKSLCRFKCVSKFFLTLIQDPSFIDTICPQTSILLQIQSPEDNCLYVYSIDSNGVSSMKHQYELRGDFDYFGHFKVRYCNGLNSYFDHHTPSLHVCNVAIKEDSITLPRWFEDYFLCFDSSSGKYKVLGWLEEYDSEVTYPLDLDEYEGIPLKFQILTLERDPSWRPVMNPLKIAYLFEPDVIINGEPFWLEIYGKEKRIVSFNTTIEEFRAISLPDEANIDRSWYAIFEFDGSLSLVEQPRCGGPTFKLWILNGTIWVLMKNITLPFEGTNLHECYIMSSDEYHQYYSANHVAQYINTQPWSVESFNFSSRGGELLVAEFVVKDNKFMFIYNFLNNQFRRINITDLPFSGFTRRNSMEKGFKMRNYVKKCFSVQGLA